MDINQKRTLFTVPNCFTMLNLMLGCTAIALLFEEQHFWATFCFLGALLCDFLDGLLARVLKQSSPIGAQLDSLADTISFGAFPGFLAFFMIQETPSCIWACGLLGFLIPAFSALRLAKFNVDPEQSTSFKGLATPANALFWVGYFYVVHNEMLGRFFINDITIFAVIIITSILLIGNTPMFSFKLKSFDLQSIWPQIILVVLSIILFIWLKFAAFAPIVIAYVLLSVLHNQINRSKSL